MAPAEHCDVIYICWECGNDFRVTECDGFTDSLEVICPGCGSDLVAIDFAAVRRCRTIDSHRRGRSDDRACVLPESWQSAEREG